MSIADQVFALTKTSYHQVFEKMVEEIKKDAMTGALSKTYRQKFEEALMQIFRENGFQVEYKHTPAGSCSCDYGCSNCSFYCEKHETIIGWRK